MMILFVFYILFLSGFYFLYFTLRVFLFGFGLVLAGVALLSAVFYLSFHAVAVVALI